MSDNTPMAEDNGRFDNLTQSKRKTNALERMAAALEKSASKETGSYDALILALIDGTADGFKRALKTYLTINGIGHDSSAADITSKVTSFYQLLQDNYEWDGTTTFYDPDVSSQSGGVRGGDNAGMTCVPSTADTANRDDYAGLPLFAVVDCNWQIDATSLSPQITAIEGICGSFDRTSPTKFVGVLQMTGYHYYTNPQEASNQSYIEGYRIGMDANKPHCAPLPEAVAVDGTVRPWMIHGKYAAGLKDGKLTCCSGIAEEGQLSHNSIQSYAHAIGTAYSGMCACDLSFLHLMTRIKYASLTLEDSMNFAYNYWYRDVAAVAETGVKRIIIAASSKANYVVGSQIIVGTAAGNDVQDAAMYSISGANGWTITDITDVTINSTKYAAIYVNSDATFDTGAGNTDASKNTAIHTVRWKTGSTDHVKGNDGAIDPKSGKYPVKLQGIEFGLGAYEIVGDTILKLYQDTTDTSKYWYEPYTCKKSANQSTGLTDNYIASGAKFNQATAEGYVKTLKWGRDGVLFPELTGGSSSTYTRDYIWHNSKTVDTREWLALGGLNNGANAGLSFLYGDNWLGWAWWHYASRLSPNGNRG
ncbi:hypothetical protein [Mitsuokella jalaludinii]|uniref:hypothetical protein n=1 Tax=Mitsuokella jalaludinii TaxID=187979 RepID=UPI0020D1EA71|nr:hypothetical protein [Mitsuokella jalaludinii]MCQ1533876.1 hypothetical protein [Mitsuokella jalaludinii]